MSGRLQDCAGPTGVGRHTGLATAMGHGGTDITALDDQAGFTGVRGHVLPPVQVNNKYERALARHYEMKFPQTRPADEDPSGLEWMHGTHSSSDSLSSAAPIIRPKTPNCPWGVDRKIFSGPPPSRAGGQRSQSSMDMYGRDVASPVLVRPDQKAKWSLNPGQMVPQVVAGYTGTLTGLRETVGQTHGHAQAILGRMSPAFIPMYRREDIVGDKMGICRSGYPSFVRADTEWSRRPTTAMRPLVKDPLARESGMDIVKQLSNSLVDRVTTKMPWPIHKVLLDLRRASIKRLATPPFMTKEETRNLFNIMKVEMTEREVDALFAILALPEDDGQMRIETLCDALYQKQNDHPLTKPSRSSVRRLPSRIGQRSHSY